ncbi:MAG: RNA 2',3'-cyclic phosphodiesterase [Pseudomonadota bacterium]
MIRAFVALSLPGQAVWQLEGAQAGLPVGRAVPPENFHITLAFLGEIRTTVLEDVHSALSAIRAPAFSVGLNGVDVFGGRQPTSLHATVTADPGLDHLQAKVVQASRQAGVTPKAGRYTPHVTLARFGKGMSGEDAARLRAFVSGRLSFRVAPFEVGGFTLFRSRLGKRPHYDALAHYTLVTGSAGGRDTPGDTPAETWEAGRFSAGW